LHLYRLSKLLKNSYLKTAVEGQNKDIEQQVLDLVLKYMENEENIILAIQVLLRILKFKI